MTTLTIKDIREVIKNLPDDMEVCAVNSNGDCTVVAMYVTEKYEDVPGEDAKVIGHHLVVDTD